MNAIIELTQADLRELLAKHWKVQPADVTIIIDKGYDDPRDHVGPSVSVKIKVPTDRLEKP